MSVSGEGAGVVAHAGNVGVRLLADRTGQAAEMSKPSGWIPATSSLSRAPANSLTAED